MHIDMPTSNVIRVLKLLLKNTSPHYSVGPNYGPTMRKTKFKLIMWFIFANQLTSVVLKNKGVATNLFFHSCNWQPKLDSSL